MNRPSDRYPLSKSPSNFANDILTLYCRILISSFTSFLPRNIPTYIVQSSPLNHFKQHGRKNSNLKNMPCITTHWMMGLKNCRNIIISLISNRHFSLHSVSFLYVEDKSKTINTVSKYYILISNSNTSRNIGVGNRGENKSWKKVMLMPETGKIRHKRWLNVL